jgi:hypothetical protein
MNFNLNKVLNILLPFIILIEVTLLVFYFLTEESFLYLYFSHTYNIIGILSAGIIFSAANYWGASKSYLGKSLIFLGFGQMFLFLGQNVCTFLRIYENLEKCPYPSYAEIFFAGSIFFYIFASYYLACSMGVLKAIKKTFLYQVLAFLIAGAMIWFALYKFSEVNGLTNIEDLKLLVRENTYVYLILELIYPFGAGIYTAIAILASFGSTRISGGKLIRGCILILLGFFLQFAGDTAYIWTAGVVSDILYFTSFILIAYAGQSFVMAITQIKQSAKINYTNTTNGGQKPRN